MPGKSRNAPPPDLNEIWTDNPRRFQTRARASGVLNAQTLLGEAMTQVDKGWLENPYQLTQWEMWELTTTGW